MKSLATNAREWGQLFSIAQSGTYTNQWITVDYKMIVNGSMPSSNVVWIAEELPGIVNTADVTDLVLKSHFGNSR